MAENSPFIDIEPVPLFDSNGKVAGQGVLNNTAEMQVGFGSQVLRMNREGLWMGAEKFADAPFSVDMLGNLIAASATLSGYSKISVFKQTSIPTSGAVGDLWVDTDDSNKVYRAASVGADQITSGEWEEVTVDAIIKSATSQTLSGNFNLNDANVLIDGANKRILINDGTNDRILIGYQSSGF